MGSFFTLYLTSAAAFFSIDSENEHENAQGVIGVYNIYGIGIRPVKQLLRYRCYRLAVRTFDGVIPGQKIAVDLPAVKVYIKLLLEQSKALCYAADVFILAEIYLELRLKKRENALSHSADVLSVAVENMQDVPPAELSLDGEDGVSRLIVNIIAVKPREKSLLKE